ncbi:MAG: SIMPL domain-containing protein [Actinobacteria bacterium]|uniref:SIMPL domain-containing protein n=1 Tax=Candidatus Fonsibacter lacus TaxID=2576439 RepID=A0A965LKV7_9PROT|nr:SIMPL domain-containing protein [Candidatus Fonsibacter lacus]
MKIKANALSLLVGVISLSLALFFGLLQIGSGISQRNSEGITVTGSARVEALADKANWVITVQEIATNPSDGIVKVKLGVAAVQKYLIGGGIKPDSISLTGLNSFANEEFENGNPTGRIASYRISRDIVVRSNEVNLVDSLSQNIGTLIEQGFAVNSIPPAYYISNLPELRPKLLENAMKDAKTRAEAITKATTGKVGAPKTVRSGPFQVTARDSINAEDYGAYDTSTIAKTVTATVSVFFAIDQ